MSTAEIPINDESINWQEIVEITQNGGTFLTSDHTAKHFRELWMSELFLSESPFDNKQWDGTEKGILSKCELRWKENLMKWQPPEWPDEKIKALDDLVKRAKREFNID
ncbi:MAG: trimethylamine methyltransferase family protein [Spirochaetota bacterium]